jgi:predicted Zn-dependent protease
MRRGGIAAALTVLSLLQSGAAAAQCVEVTPGICLTRKHYAAPINEQPFYGFAAKTPAMIEADRKFIASVLQFGADKEQAALRVAHIAWDAFDAGDLANAGRRFNQAFLIDPQQSAIYHGFAVLAEKRFNDPVFAEELFVTARKLFQPLPTLDADYARLLLVLKRPKDALPLLEQAVKDVPALTTAWSNLAFARFQTGDSAGACAAAAEAMRRTPGPAVRVDVERLRRQASCG